MKSRTLTLLVILGVLTPLAAYSVYAAIKSPRAQYIKEKALDKLVEFIFMDGESEKDDYE